MSNQGFDLQLVVPLDRETLLAKFDGIRQFVEHQEPLGDGNPAVGSIPEKGPECGRTR